MQLIKGDQNITLNKTVLDEKKKAPIAYPLCLPSKVSERKTVTLTFSPLGKNAASSVEFPV